MAYDIQVFHPFTISHGAAFLHAQAVVPHLLSTYQAQLTAPAQTNWQGARCTFCLPTSVGNITGIIDIHPVQVALYIELPLLAKLKRGQIEQTVRTFLTTNFQ